MNRAKAIMHLFPNADPIKDFIVKDDADGTAPYIAEWNLSEPQPTEAELAAAWVQVKDAPTPPSLEEQVQQIQAVLNAMMGI